MPRRLLDHVLNVDADLFVRREWVGLATASMRATAVVG